MTIMPDYKRLRNIKFQTMMAIGIVSIIHFLIVRLFKHGLIPYEFYAIEWKGVMFLLIAIITSGPIRMGIRK